MDVHLVKRGEMQSPIHGPSLGSGPTFSDVGHTGAGPDHSEIPPFVPPPTPGIDPGVSKGSERGPLGLLGVMVFVMFAIIMIAMVAGSGITDTPFGGLFILAIVVMIIFAVVRFAIVNSSPPPEPVEAPSPMVTREVRVETVRETVKVRCRYCGTLNLETDTKCQSCGGNL